MRVSYGSGSGREQRRKQARSWAISLADRDKRETRLTVSLGTTQIVFQCIDLVVCSFPYCHLVVAPATACFFFGFFGTTTGRDPYFPTVRWVPHVRQSPFSGTEQKMLRQILQTKPILTILRWQKHAARKSTSIRVGRIKCLLRVIGLGKNESSRYVRNAWDAEAPDLWSGKSAGMKMPCVASAACWRKSVELDDGDVLPPLSVADDFCGGRGRGRCSISIGMDRRWHANMAFMMGMYWCARSVEGEAETSRIRDWREFVELASPVEDMALLEVGSAVVEVVPISDSAYAIDSRLTLLRARVKAPAIMVDVLDETDSGVVVERRVVRLRRSSSSTMRKGRYLLPSADGVEEVERGLTLSLRRWIDFESADSSWACL